VSEYEGISTELLERIRDLAGQCFVIFDSQGMDEAKENAKAVVQDATEELNARSVASDG
jgi:hypothetical protein